MPEMDGFEATRHIRDPYSSVRNHAIPIIAMTAHAMQGDRERCLQAGMNDYVVKPISPRALAEALGKWLPKESSDQVPGLPEAAVSTQQQEVPVFDRAGLMDRLMDDADLARTVIAAFLEDIPRQIEALRDHLEAGDAKNVERQAHTIRSAAANIGGEAMRMVAREMEDEGRAGNLKAVNAQLAELELRFARLGEALAKELPNPGQNEEGTWQKA
jgi:HPt (histidine-containing phosphotransfer) domain-containing protein